MPPKTRLPEGPHRSFVEEIFMHYREAGRPSLRTISSWIKDNADGRDLRGTASTETIRRVLTGATIPRGWPTVEAILEALCGIADRDPNEDRWEDEGYGSTSLRTELMNRWNAMLDDYNKDEEMPTMPPRRVPQQQPSGDFDDPWATAPAPVRSVASSFDDEPPF